MNRIAAISMLALISAAPAAGQQAPEQPAPTQSSQWDPATRLAQQREAMEALSFLDGSWRGEAQAAQGGPLVQTERVGTLLDGSVRLVEGRGYNGDGRTVFNALGIISYDPVRKTYSMRSHAMGFAGDFPITIRPDGFSWSRPGGAGATIRYTATVTGDEWHEVGERVVGDAAPVKMFEMRLRRVGASDWPQAGAVAPR